MEQDSGQGRLHIFKRIFFARVGIPIILLLIIISLAAVGGGYAVGTRPGMFGFEPSQEEAQEQVDELISQVRELINLPDDEEPTIATVTDVEKVKEQPFFREAQNGDRVLIYQNARKAILYRPSENRVIEVGSLNLDQQQGVQEDVAGDQDTSEDDNEEDEAATPEPTEEPVSTATFAPQPTAEPTEEVEAVEEE